MTTSAIRAEGKLKLRSNCYLEFWLLSSQFESRQCPIIQTSAINADTARLIIDSSLPDSLGTWHRTSHHYHHRRHRRHRGTAGSRQHMASGSPHGGEPVARADDKCLWPMQRTEVT